jgi:hypothetical protein
MENIFELVDKKLKQLREENAESTINTSDEKALEKMLSQSPAILNRLKAIEQINELDGFFKVIIQKTNLNKVSKQTIMNSLRTALTSIAPDSQTISTNKK